VPFTVIVALLLQEVAQLELSIHTMLVGQVAQRYAPDEYKAVLPIPNGN